MEKGKARLRASLEGWDDETPGGFVRGDSTLTPDVLQSEDGKEGGGVESVVVLPSREELEMFDWACSQNPRVRYPKSPLPFYAGIPTEGGRGEGAITAAQRDLQKRIEAAKKGIEIVGPL